MSLNIFQRLWIYDHDQFREWRKEDGELLGMYISVSYRCHSNNGVRFQGRLHLLLQWIDDRIYGHHWTCPYVGASCISRLSIRRFDPVLLEHGHDRRRRQHDHKPANYYSSEHYNPSEQYTEFHRSTDTISST